jgi:hypothetical protein
MARLVRATYGIFRLTGIVAMTLFVMARLVRATCTSTLPRQVARTSRAMTVWQRPPPFQSA